MLAHICYEGCLRDNGCGECRLKCLKIRLYDIKNVVLQRRITYIGRISVCRPLSFNLQNLHTFYHIAKIPSKLFQESLIK